jgi:translocation and assembly module TamB
MAGEGDTAPVAAAVDTPPPALRPLGWRQKAMASVLGLFALLALGLVILDSSLGHRFIIDRIAALTPANGLRVEIGRIDGSLFGEAVLHDIQLKDPRGTFMTVPEAELDWRPFAWLKSGLDIRKLVLHRGHLLRRPAFNKGEPGGSVLPNFDIRIDRLEIDNLTADKGVFGPRRRIDLVARADIRKGRALLDVDGRFGGGDRLLVKLDSEPDRDRFDLAVDYSAPRGGLLAGVSGATSSVRAKVYGAGAWKTWNGVIVAQRDGKDLAAMLLANRAGRYTMAGEVYPGDLLAGRARAAAGDKLALRFDGTFVDNVIDGRLALSGAALAVGSRGRLDLGNNAADGLFVRALALRPELLLPSPKLAGVQLVATLDGPFRDLSIDHVLTAARLDAGSVVAENLRTAGVARWNGKTLTLPLALTAGRVVTGNAQVDPRFAGGRVTGTLALTGSQLASEDLAIDLRGLAARLVMRGDLKGGGFAFAGPVAARGFSLTNLGLVDADAKILFKIGAGMPWTLQANLAGRMTRVDNATLQTLTGGGIRFAGGVRLGQQVPILFDKARLTSAKLALNADGRQLGDGTTTITGNGRHVDYGPFTVQADIGAAGPKAVLVFADPWPAGGLKDVRVALSPIAEGFRIETAGGSTLGPFDGVLALFSPPGGPTRIEIRQMKVWQTGVTGTLLLGGSGVSGELALAGGGLSGQIRIDPRGNGQQIDALVTARNARFGGPRPLSIGNGRLEVSGFLEKGRSTIAGNVYAEGLSSGSLFIGKLAANARLVNGAGQVTASIAGRRGSRFAVQGTAAISPDRVVVLAGGDYAGRSIRMPRRAVLTREGEGWRLAPTQLDFGNGTIIAEGHLLGGPTELNLQVADMPLSAADIFVADLGLGGTASGIVDYRSAGGVPSGRARLMVKGLTRSGLVLTSRPVDLYLVAALDRDALETRSVIEEKGETRGRLQARIAGLPQGGSLRERLRSGSLFGQLRYNGPADALWRLTGVEIFDLTGPVAIAADMTGTLDNPQVRGAMSSSDLRVQSALTGTDLQKVTMRGSFAGSRLTLSNFAGTTANGGRIAGSGTVDLSDIAERGVPLDLRLSATNAQILNRDDMAATVTGPLRIRSDGIGGTIAGRVRIEEARWQLGRAAAALALPEIRTREINRPADVAPPRVAARPWNWLIDAAGDGKIEVRGLGLDSEWGANVRLRGDTSNPQIFGNANLVRGGYEFAGKRFELTRGRIAFDGNVPVDPRLDIVAEGDTEGISARIAITGSSLRPSITFSSTPALPEEELLSRILFGSSITQISAPEALQLAAAVASLRGGSGLDPINKLRTAIGLDRLRIVGADAARGSGTSIAVGKYIGRRFFVELVTDGKGYSATSVEFRITRWLALLGTISTIGNQSVNLKVSKDY